MPQETFTAPLAVVTDQNNKPIAKIRNLSIRETHQLGEVQGLGNLTKKELPKLAINCSGSFSFYNVDFNKSTIPKANQRNFNSMKAYLNHTLMLDGSVIRIKRKQQSGIDPNTKHRSTTLVTFATIKNIYIEEDSFDLSEGQVSTKTQSFRYTEPILIGL